MYGVRGDDEDWCKSMEGRRIWEDGRVSWTGSVPPRWHELSNRTRHSFSRCGAVRIDTGMFVDDSNGGKGTEYGYGREEIDSIRLVRDTIVDAIEAHLKAGDRVGVVGSMSPRYEAACLALGAKETVTIEYNRLVFDHPSMRTTTPDEFFATEETFDLLIMASSLDHDGLGRYNDPIAPDGDLMTMDMLRNRASLLILSVPVGPDAVAFNLMRIYGPIRLPLLLDGFDIVDTFNYDPARLDAPVKNIRKAYEPVFVLRSSERNPPPDSSNDELRRRR